MAHTMMDLEIQAEIAAQLTGVEVLMDWQAYFAEFDKVHGGNSVPYENRLLYRDGWIYGATHESQEWKPPEDNKQLRDLMLIYWTTRKGLLRQRHDSIERCINDVRSMQNARSLPLKQKRAFVDDKGKRVIQRTDVNIDDLKRKLKWFAEDVVECEWMINRLNTMPLNVPQADYTRMVDNKIYRDMVNAMNADALKQPAPVASGPFAKYEPGHDVIDKHKRHAAPPVQEQDDDRD